MVPCDFHMFREVEYEFKGTIFQTDEDVKEKAIRVRKQLTEDFQHCFKQWKIHMER